MRRIERVIEVHYRLEVHFTRGVFDLRNPLLADVLAPAGARAGAKVLVVLDDALVQAQPALPGAVAAYLGSFQDRLVPAAPPLVIEGGEGAKNSSFHVSEIQSRIDRHHIDRHSYVIAV